MSTQADIIIRNGKVLTMDDANPRAEALAIAGNKIVAVGSEADVAALSGPATRVIDAGGGTVLPGFNEAHLHIFGGSVELSELSLFRVKGFDALKQKVLEYAAANPDLALIIGQSADYTIISDEERVTRHHLDAILPDRPLLIFAPDHHTAWANTIALTKAGILEGRDVGIGNEIVMAEDGLASGELRESNAIRPVSALGKTGGREMLGVGTGGEPENITAADRAADKEVLKQGMAYCASLGLTSIQNMDGNLYQLELMDEIEKEDGLPVRVRIPFHMKNFMPLSDLETKAAAWRARFQTDRLKCDFVKMFMDGVTEGETAVFVDDYSHKPGWKGEPLFSQAHFNEIATAADKLGLQIAVHAIGDGAVRMVLNGYEAASKANGKRDSRNRVEHVEVIHPDDIPRFAELGAGDFPDGGTFDALGGYWVTSVVSNRIYRFESDGRPRLMFEDADAGYMAMAEEAYGKEGLTVDILYADAGRTLNHIASIAFGGEDMRTAYLGTLKMDCFPTFRSPVPGTRPAHWDWSF